MKNFQNILGVFFAFIALWTQCSTEIYGKKATASKKSFSRNASGKSGSSGGIANNSKNISSNNIMMLGGSKIQTPVLSGMSGAKINSDVQQKGKKINENIQEKAQEISKDIEQKAKETSKEIKEKSQEITQKIVNFKTAIPSVPKIKI